MEYLPIILDAFLKFLSCLELFFFCPISELAASLPSQLLGMDGPLGSLLDAVLTLLSKLTFGSLADLTVFQLLLGGGIIVILLYKLILFLLPVAD